MSMTFSAIRLGNSTSVTTGAGSARVAIPTNAAGNVPKYVRILPAGANAWVRPGDSAVNATGNDILCSPNTDLILNVTGFTHIAYLQQGTATQLSIAAVEA